jgi:hypothetical protein
MIAASANSSLEKGRPDDEPVAMLMGNGTHGIAPRSKHRVFSMAEVEQAIPQSFQRASGGSVRDGLGRIVRAGRGGNLRYAHGRNLQSYLTTEEVTKAVSNVVNPLEDKELAHATGGSLRAANNVRNGLNAMSLTAFLNACRAIPELRALAMDLMGCDAETDPDFVRGVTLLMNSFARRRASEASDGAPRTVDGVSSLNFAGGSDDDSTVTGDLFAGEGADGT